MNLSFLPLNIRQALSNLNLEDVYEIRLRKGFAIKILYNGNFLYLVNNGVSKLREQAIICDDYAIDEIINIVTEHSLYAFNEQICKGYLRADNGIRIGLGGECVVDNDKIITIKNFSSLNIRIPHQVKGCAKKIINSIIVDNNVLNTLIISPPLFGKTTILKDVACFLNELNIGTIMIIDERGEFESIKGENIDFIRYLDKCKAFNLGIRALAPRVIITDELLGGEDWKCIDSAVNSGVKIIASCHAKNIKELKLKNGFKDKLFDRYVLLRDCNFNNQQIDVYNEDFIKL